MGGPHNQAISDLIDHVRLEKQREPGWQNLTRAGQQANIFAGAVAELLEVVLGRVDDEDTDTLADLVTALVEAMAYANADLIRQMAPNARVLGVKLVYGRLMLELFGDPAKAAAVN